MSTTYRATVKTWEYTRRCAMCPVVRRQVTRAGKRHELDILNELHALMTAHRPQSRDDVAWAERSDRHGVTTLAAHSAVYDPNSGWFWGMAS